MNTVKDFPIQQNRLINAGFLLVCLCLLDAVFTDYGLRFGLIEEANLLVSFLYEQSIPLFYVVKLGLPLILLYIVTISKLGFWVRITMTTALFLYIAVLFVHIFWLVISSI
ncbi:MULTISPECIES: DUF5658 family protein [unclassified Sporosarcina]|uniref:DUF5658 family protein n=1 Tax=unclassified Sporosarcina TaxID=2647733 RepID=UPI000C16705E|nr:MULTISPECIES: DUF5658 family protein [unclassified Sporosarcina]PIC99411.1 hypothetical protein CSV68_08340 [Sporosarcina sp. P29]PID06272.1 hypothetical protein CSV66_05360 [Sporosarcina sp. P30]PID09466.1 hypothetical protein CSV65_05360 [Sporosarcina sp. P31]PID12764.1 hypothetical protein CSV64_04825 [Sporosarcina sp. P32b]